MGKTSHLGYSFFMMLHTKKKLLKFANVSQSYSKNNTGTVFSETWCRIHWQIQDRAKGVRF